MNKNDIAQNTIAELANYVNAARRDLTSACTNALKAGAYLHCIHAGGKISMVEALDKIGLNKSTAYRWMNAYHTACKVLGMDNPPTNKSKDWGEHLDSLGEVAAKMTLSRLALGAPAAGTDLARLDAIQTGMETAETDKELLDHLNAERADLAAAVPEDSLGEYERMTKSKGVPVIVPMDEKGHCGGCHMVITDNARMKVLGGHETVYCDSCHRILH